MSFRQRCSRARILLAIVVVLIVLVVVAAPRVRDCERYLTGFWSGDPAFLKESGLSEMFIYIAPREKADGRWRRQGYLVMTDDEGKMISKQGLELSWASTMKRWSSVVKSHFSRRAQETYRVPHVDIVFDDEDIMPEQLSLGLNMTDGTLALHSDEKLYAFFIKDNETSLSANSTWAKDDEVYGGS